MLCLNILELSCNLSLIVLMLRTEKRTLDNRRPEASDQLNVLLLSTDPGQRRKSSADRSGPFIRVRFYDKVIQGREGINLFQFRVTTHDAEIGELKLTKKYAEFQQLQNLVSEHAAKQSDVFGEPSLGAGRRDTHLSSNTTNGVKVKHTGSYSASGAPHSVPRLEDLFGSISERSGYVHSDAVVSFIKNLERFCNEVADNKLFWTHDIISFFGIPEHGAIRATFEREREAYSRSLSKDGLGSIRGEARRQSYVNFDAEMLDSGSEIVPEDDVAGETGSTKNANKP